MKKYICEALNNYIAQNHNPWHMPGHKRKALAENNSGDDSLLDREDLSLEKVIDGVMHFDITEVDGMDDFHHPEGIIRSSMEELAGIYESEASFYLVNGSTSGIFAAVAACVRDREHKIIVADNCHKSVWNAANILAVEAERFPVDKLAHTDIYGSVNVKRLEDVLEKYKNGQSEGTVDAVVITSPTYEGIISDVETIGNVCRKYGVKLIVDSAHGAHLRFIKDVVKAGFSRGTMTDADSCKICNQNAKKSKDMLSKNKSSANIVVQSFHKTLPSPTQTAVIHVYDETLVEDVKKYISMFVSSSPSYIMLAAMENAVATAQEKDYRQYISNLLEFREKVNGLQHISLLDEKYNSAQDNEGFIYAYDLTRIVISVNEGEAKMPGNALIRLLEQKGDIVAEMAGLDYTVLISTAWDEKNDFEHLLETLKIIDEECAEKSTGKCTEKYEKKNTEKSIKPGQTAERDIYVYPPGIFIVREGEKITEEKLEYLQRLSDSGAKITGL